MISYTKQYRIVCDKRVVDAITYKSYPYGYSPPLGDVDIVNVKNLMELLTVLVNIFKEQPCPRHLYIASLVWFLTSFCLYVVFPGHKKSRGRLHDTHPRGSDRSGIFPHTSRGNRPSGSAPLFGVLGI